MAQPRLPSLNPLVEPVAPISPVALGRPAIYADVEALPAHLRGEIVGGELYVLPRPRPQHADAASNLTTDLKNPFQRGRGGPGGWWILPEPEVHLVPRQPIDPDIAGWRRERMPTLPTTAFIALAPDWICEVLSDSTHAYDRGAKMEAYGSHGVPWAWLLDPDQQTLEVYRNDAGSWRPEGTWQGVQRARAAPFEDIEIELALLWG